MERKLLVCWATIKPIAPGAELLWSYNSHGHDAGVCVCVRGRVCVCVRVRLHVHARAYT